MEIYSTKKIVSLHLEPCEHGCPNQDVCYLKKRESVSKGFPLPSDLRERMLEQGFVIHEALCRPMTDYHLKLLKDFKDYNVTISSSDFKATSCSNCERQLQISIYGSDVSRIRSLPRNSTKLFLVKDDESHQVAQRLCKEFNDLHINVDRLWTSAMAVFFLKNSRQNISVDSCLESWMINGECPYTTDYVDISHDWTLRKCPFSVHGTPIPKDFITNNNYTDLFSLEHRPEPCAYADKFKEKRWKIV